MSGPTAAYVPRFATTAIGRTLMKVPLVSHALRAATGAYHGSLARNLNNHGLKLDDVYVVTKDVSNAINSLDPAVLNARNQRLKRAMDLSMKHTYLQKDMQSRLDPFESYLQEPTAVAMAARLERQALSKD